MEYIECNIPQASLLLVWWSGDPLPSNLLSLCSQLHQGHHFGSKYPPRRHQFFHVTGTRQTLEKLFNLRRTVQYMLTCAQMNVSIRTHTYICNDELNVDKHPLLLQNIMYVLYVHTHTHECHVKFISCFEFVCVCN